MEDSEDEDTSEDEETYILLMGIETQAQDGESDEEGEVDLKSKLISALEELEKCRKNKQTVKPNHQLLKEPTSRGQED